MRQRLLKALRSVDAKFIVQGGTVLVSRLSYFQRLEAGAADIADPYEGMSRRVLAGPFAFRPGEQRELMRSMDVWMDDASSVRGSDWNKICSIAPDDYVFSLAFAAPIEHLQEHRRRDVSSYRYDACLPVRDARQLFTDITTNGRIIAALGPERTEINPPIPTSEYFEECEFRKVRYTEAIRVDARSGRRPVAAGPFFKEPKFGWQHEKRLLLRPWPRSRQLPNRLVIELPRRDYFDAIVTLD
jgi:hypothetical protein